MKLEPLIEEFFASGRIAALSVDPNELHAFRIAGKRLRYSIEILDPNGGAKVLLRLKEVQTQLGDMHDAFVAEEFLRGLPKLSPAARRVSTELHARGMDLIERFQRTWRRRFGKRTEKAWITWARQADQ
ncbi:MAG: CHAD domain-containing protein [Acidobacteria bacterium]|nr:CHAD domain-containing protein [Acidobacteriota bacterium]